MALASEAIGIITFSRDSKILSAAADLGKQLGVQKASGKLLDLAGTAGTLTRDMLTPTQQNAARVVADAVRFIGGDTPGAVGAAFGSPGAALEKTGARMFGSRIIEPIGKLAAGDIPKVFSTLFRRGTTSAVKKETRNLGAIAIEDAIKASTRETAIKQVGRDFEQAAVKRVASTSEKNEARAAILRSQKQVEQVAINQLEHQRALASIAKDLDRARMPGGLSLKNALLTAGVGAAAVTVPLLTYGIGKTVGSDELMQQLQKEVANLPPELTPTVDSGVPDPYAEQGIPYWDPYAGQTPIESVPPWDGTGTQSYIPEYVPGDMANAPISEISSTGMPDFGSNTMALADYTDNPDDFQTDTEQLEEIGIEEEEILIDIGTEEVLPIVM